MIVMGVNEADYDPEKHTIISLLPAQQIVLRPWQKVLDDNFDIKKRAYDNYPCLYQ